MCAGRLPTLSDSPSTGCEMKSSERLSGGWLLVIGSSSLYGSEPGCLPRRPEPTLDSGLKPLRRHCGEQC